MDALGVPILEGERLQLGLDGREVRGPGEITQFKRISLKVKQHRCQAARVDILVLAAPDHA